MKCSDISRILDEQEFAGLSAADLADLESHVSECAECARQCLASEQLMSFRTAVPAVPAALQERARHLHASCESANSPKSTRRPVIIGSLFLLGAAATTMFAVVPARETSTASQ